MKFYETTFDEYLEKVNEYNLHPKLSKLYSEFPNKIEHFKNLIFYGPSGVGKESQMLFAIKKYSPSHLKYEKKIKIDYNKDESILKISDIHYEVDMGLLGCNSRQLWHEIYQSIIDIISTKSDKSGIIVCKNFHNISNDLLDVFYSYMQKNISVTKINCKFIFLTEEISFINANILNACCTISVTRPSRSNYNKFIEKGKLKPCYNINEITNIKYLKSDIYEKCEMIESISSQIICNISDLYEIKYSELRENIYKILIYNLNLFHCIHYIIDYLISNNKINKENAFYIYIQYFNTLKLYNNNYRPIYHIEKLFLSISHNIHNKDNINNIHMIKK